MYQRRPPPPAIESGVDDACVWTYVTAFVFSPVQPRAGRVNYLHFYPLRSDAFGFKGTWKCHHTGKIRYAR